MTMSAPGSSTSVPSFPSYVEDWAGEVRYASAEDFARITEPVYPPQYTFVLQKPGESFARVVVQKRCRNCKCLKKADCSRDEPCDSCRKNGFRCVYSDGYTQLATIESASQHDQLISLSKDTPSSHQMLVDEPEPAFASHSSSRDKDDLFKTSHKSRKGRETLPNELGNIDVHEEKSKSQSSPKRGRPETGDTIVSRKNNVTWQTTGTNQSSPRNVNPRKEPDRKPYLWSENYEELLGAIPLLSVVNNGVSAEDDLSPMILLTSPLWSGEWDGSGTMKLITMRNFCYSQSGVKSVPPGDGEEADSDEDFEYPKEDDMEIDLDEDPNGPFSFQSIGHDGTYSLPFSELLNMMPNWDKTDEPFNDRGGHWPDTGGTNTVKAPETYPDEISTLCKAYKAGMPVSAIMEADWSGSPFRLHDGCAFAILGFFNIIDFQTTMTQQPPLTRKNGSRFARGMMNWSFTLRWLPSGPLDLDIPVDLDGRPHDVPTRPWWSASVLPPEECAEPMMERDLFEPFFVGATIVAQAILCDAFDDDPGKIDASKRSWVCRRCGKINLTNWIGEYVCSYSYCAHKVSGPVKLIQPFSVRDRHRFRPMWEPSMQIPEGVTRNLTILEHGWKLFSFTINRAPLHGQGTGSSMSTSQQISAGTCNGTAQESDKGKGKEWVCEPEVDIRDKDRVIGQTEPAVVVEMLFPGNIESLEEHANASFIAFQKECPMRFEKTDHRGTAGIYTFRTSPNLPGEFSRTEGYSDWNSAPACMKSVAEGMANHARKNLGRDLDISRQHAFAIAWLGESPVKKVLPIRAKQSPAMLMCLGADLDVVFPKPGEVQQKSPSKPKSRSRKVVSTGTGEHNETSWAGKFDEIWANAEGSETNKALTAPDRFRLTMTHGSIIVISGDDIEVTVLRTDFAILVTMFAE